MININEIKNERDAAPYGAKAEVVKRYAELHGVSEKSIYRSLSKNFGPARSRRSKVIIEDKHIDAVAQLKAKSMSLGQKARELTTEDAIEILEDSGTVPRGLLKVSTVNRRLNEKGFRDAKPTQRYLEEFCNQAHYLDFSRSEYIGIKTYDQERGEYILVTSEKSLRYKNKGQSFGLWLAGLRDGKSGIRLVKYYTVTGENMFMGMDFLKWAWSRPDDGHPLNSIPHILRHDNGALAKRNEFQNFLKALSVESMPSQPYNKQAMGKIERTWRTLWQRFELKLIMTIGGGVEMTLDHLNDLVLEYCIEEGQKAHTLYKNISKQALYSRELIGYPPRKYDGDFDNLASKPRRRKVGTDLIFWLDNEPYKAPARYVGKWVLIHKNINGDMVGEGEEDGQRFEIDYFNPNTLGEYKAHKDTYREQMEKAFKENPDNTISFQPKPQQIKPESPHAQTPEAEDSDELTIDTAKQYIANQLHLNSYSEVAHYFDELLESRTDKEALDKVINILRRQVRQAI